MKRLSFADRFNSKFRITPGCWIWTAAIGNKGYGHFWSVVRPEPAHRVSYRLHNGEIADGLLVLHRCDNRLCVNPDHLFLGTNQDNMTDMVKKDRQAKGSSLGAAKLDESQIASIRADSRSQRKIAAEYGVSHTAIGEIKNNRLWRHA